MFRKHYLHSADDIPADWECLVVKLWEEDDAPVPDKERVQSAFQRISQSYGKPLRTIDGGDEIVSFYRGGWVKAVNYEGGWVGILLLRQGK